MSLVYKDWDYANVRRAIPLDILILLVSKPHCQKYEKFLDDVNHGDYTVVLHVGCEFRVGVLFILVRGNDGVFYIYNPHYN